jgi:hypothetical protein
MDFENHIFEPDVVLSDELTGARGGPATPERTLMIAVLEDAARCFLHHCTATERKARALYEDARDWFLSTEHAGLYDFENVCHVLGIDPAYLRRRMLAERDRRRARAAAAPSDFVRTGDRPGQRATG